MARSKPVRRRRAGANDGVVTLEMVAAEAGVSPSTVSRILNATAKVRDGKVRAVEAAIAKLQFIPNPVARSLARGKSMSVGVVTQAIASPFYGEALSAIEKGLLRAGYSVLFVSGHWRADDERRCVEHLLARRVEGIILLTSSLPDQELAQLSRVLPVVVTGRQLAGDRLYCLDVNSTSGARLATEYLIGLGHRKIALLSGAPERPDSQQRLEGYKSALAAARIPFRKQLVTTGHYTESGGFSAMNALLDSREEFTAVFAANDQSAHGAMLALYRRGLQIPKDISVVGFDDLPSSAFTIPPLTTVHRFTDEVGEGAAEAIVDLIERRPVHATVSPPTLAIRESTRSLRS